MRALLKAQGLSVNDVARALQAQNADVPGGRLDQGAQSLTLRTRGRIDTIDGFDDVVLREVDGHPVRLRDVARVEDGMAEPATEASVNGDATVLLQIRKQSGTNTVEVATNVKRRLAELEAILPPGYALRIVRDEAQFIEASIGNVQEHLVVGSILAALVVFLFLGNFRSTVIAAVAIPTSIIATFALDLVHGLHAQHADDAGADAVGRHRHRRRHRRAREHLPVHRGEGHAAAPGGGRGHQRDRPGGDGDDASRWSRSSPRSGS